MVEYEDAKPPEVKTQTAYTPRETSGGVRTERDIVRSLQAISWSDFRLGRILSGADAVSDDHLYDECARRRLYVPHVELSELLERDEAAENALMRRQLSEWLSLSNSEPEPDTMVMVVAAAVWCLERPPSKVVEVPAAATALLAAPAAAPPVAAAAAPAAAPVAARGAAVGEGEGSGVP